MYKLHIKYCFCLAKSDFHFRTNNNNIFLFYLELTESIPVIRILLHTIEGDLKMINLM